LTALAGFDLEDFPDFRRDDGNDASFHARLAKLPLWSEEIADRPDSSLHGGLQGMLGVILSMVAHDPKQRPTASDIAKYFAGPFKGADLPFPFRERACCGMPPEPYVIEDS